MPAEGDEPAGLSSSSAWATPRRPKLPRQKRASDDEDEILASAAGCTWTLDNAPKMSEPDRVGRFLAQRARQREEEAKRELDERLARIAASRANPS